MTYGRLGFNYSRRSGLKRPDPSDIKAGLTLLTEGERLGFQPGVLPLVKEEETLRLIREEMCRHTHRSDRKYRDREIVLGEPLRTVVRRFYIALDAYVESPHPVQTPASIIQEVCTNFEAAEFFKRYRVKSFIETKGLVLLEDPPWYSDHPFCSSIEDIGDVFNYQYAIHWVDEIDDYKKGFIPCSINKDRLLSFKNMCFDLLPDRSEFLTIEPDEILLRMTSSKQLIPNSKDFKSIENWKVKSQYGSFSKGPMIAKRTVIQVAPDGARDTVILPIDVANSISYIDRQVHEIIQSIPGNGMFDDPMKILKKTIKFRRLYKYFLCRDYEKEGITKPRQLLRCMLEAISEKYPDLKLLGSLVGIYDDYTLVVDNEKLYPDRGHGLGMANSLTTLLQIVVFNLVCNELESYELGPSHKLDMLAYNDDFVAGFDSEEVLEAYWELEGLILDELSLKRKPQKSFKGTDFVFCELYGPGLNRKESYLRREVLNCLSCTSIVQAKELYSSLDGIVNRYILDLYYEEIVSYWGYEFTPKEVNLPFIFGGWKPQRYKHVDLSLNELNHNVHLRALYEASRKKVDRAPERGAAKVDFESPLSRRYRITPDDIPKEHHGRFYLGTEREVSKNFVRTSLDPGHLAYLYRKAGEDRLKTYGIELNKPRSLIDDLIEKIQSDNPGITFLILDTAKSVNYSQTRRKLVKERLWSCPNPMLSYLKYLLPAKMQDVDVDPNPLGILLGYKMSFHKELNNYEKYIVDEDYTNLKTDYTEMYSAEDYEYDIDDREAITSSYLNEQEVAEVCFLLNLPKIPVADHVSEQTKALIKIRDSLYKRDKIREQRIPNIVDFDNFKYLMEVDEFTFETKLKFVYDVIKEVFSIEEEETPKIELPQERESGRLLNLSDYGGDIPALYWGWQSDREGHEPLAFMRVVDDLMLTLSVYQTTELTRVIETKRIPNSTLEAYLHLVGIETVQIDGWSIPKQFVAVTSSFEDEDGDAFEYGDFWS